MTTIICGCSHSDWLFLALDWLGWPFCFLFNLLYCLLSRTFFLMSILQIFFFHCLSGRWRLVFVRHYWWKNFDNGNDQSDSDRFVLIGQLAWFRSIACNCHYSLLLHLSRTWRIVPAALIYNIWKDYCDFVFLLWWEGNCVLRWFQQRIFYFHIRFFQLALSHSKELFSFSGSSAISETNQLVFSICVSNQNSFSADVFLVCWLFFLPTVTFVVQKFQIRLTYLPFFRFFVWSHSFVHCYLSFLVYMVSLRSCLPLLLLSGQLSENCLRDSLCCCLRGKRCICPRFWYRAHMCSFTIFFDLDKPVATVIKGIIFFPRFPQLLKEKTQPVSKQTA